MHLFHKPLTPPVCSTWDWVRVFVAATAVLLIIPSIRYQLTVQRRWCLNGSRTVPVCRHPRHDPTRSSNSTTIISWKNHPQSVQRQVTKSTNSVGRIRVVCCHWFDAGVSTSESYFIDNNARPLKCFWTKSRHFIFYDCHFFCSLYWHVKILPDTHTRACCVESLVKL